MSVKVYTMGMLLPSLSLRLGIGVWILAMVASLFN